MVKVINFEESVDRSEILSEKRINALAISIRALFHLPAPIPFHLVFSTSNFLT